MPSPGQISPRPLSPTQGLAWKARRPRVRLRYSHFGAYLDGRFHTVAILAGDSADSQCAEAAYPKLRSLSEGLEDPRGRRNGSSLCSPIAAGPLPSEMDVGALTVARNVAKPLDANGVNGRFELSTSRKSLRVDADGSSGRSTFELRTRRSHVRVMPGAPHTPITFKYLGPIPALPQGSRS